MTNKEFCSCLRVAKKFAKQGNHYQWTILDACEAAGISLRGIAIFDKGGLYENQSVNWVQYEAKSKAHIASVFNNSIRALGEEP